MSELTVDFEAARDEIGDIVQKNTEDYYLKVEDNVDLLNMSFPSLNKLQFVKLVEYKSGHQTYPLLIKAYEESRQELTSSYMHSSKLPSYLTNLTNSNYVQDRKTRMSNLVQVPSCALCVVKD